MRRGAGDLETLRAQVKLAIDADAEAARQRLITAGTGQAMVYDAKLGEAEAISANPSIDAGLVPLLSAEAALQGTTLMLKAQEVLIVAHEWKKVAARIEVLRLGAKEAVLQASTAAELRAIAPNWQDVYAS